MDDRTLARIRRCFDDYSPTNQAAYRAFFSDAHKNMGLLLDEVDRLREALADIYERGKEAGER